MSPSLRTTVQAVHVLAGLLAASQAMAQEAAAALPSVTVTASPAREAQQRAGSLATGAAASALNVPASVTSVSAELMRAQSVTTLQEALRNVPGAQADSGFNGSHSQFFVLRGAVADSGTGSSRVLRDGVRLSNYAFVPAFTESVDVLRGPGAAIGLRSEPGGSVNIVTRQPELANFGSANLGGGAHGALDATVDLNRVLSAEQELAARLTVTRSTASEWRHVPDRLDGVKLGVAKSDGERYHLRLGVEATDQAYRPDYGLPGVGGRPAAVPQDRQLGEPWADSTTRNTLVDLHGDVEIAPDTRLALDATHLRGSSTSVRQSVGAAVAGAPPGTFVRRLAYEPGTERRINALATSLTSEQSWGATRHHLFVGLDRYTETLDQPSAGVASANNPNINVFNPVYGLTTRPGSFSFATTTQDLSSTALSLQDRIEWDDWSIVAGLRSTRQDFLYGAAGTRGVKESKTSPKLALLRKLSGADSVYASYSTGTAPNQASSASGQSLPSRKSRQVEVGWKSLWNGARLQSDVALYRLEQTNLLSGDLSTPSMFDKTLAGSGRSQGLEASLGGDLTRDLRVQLAYAYTQAKFVDNTEYPGKAIPNVARHALSLWGQYRWNAEHATGAGLYAQGARHADIQNTTVLPGYARVDLSHTWRTQLDGGRQLELQLALRNVFDKAYFVSSHLHLASYLTPGQERNLHASARYSF
ncbi:TonB-dependent siderophore receptor [Acidovorax sp. CF316]|uniref:TonB-dependent receptor n=1 Tax=Acidovorax sp. CF316 TaxID=1144317 RepID=UPI00026BEBF1|nr:TonB-dependent siderophore receptor [Acidovorax sp. CF316]EJE51443.1 TonB-dependent siderophore receptor [Acidovorax sp. CF316]